MAALVIAEHDNASLKGATLNTVTAALQCGGEVHVLVAGAQRRAPPPQAAAQIAGVAKVLHADGAAPGPRPGRERRRAGAWPSPASYSHILFAGHRRTARTSRRAWPRCSTWRRSATSPRSISADTFERPIYAGNAIATVQSADAIKVITVRTTGFEPAAASGGSAAVEAVAAVADSGMSQLPRAARSPRATGPN